MPAPDFGVLMYAPLWLVVLRRFSVTPFCVPFQSLRSYVTFNLQLKPQ